MKKVLITGITGFAGSHLAEFLLNDKNFNITGVFTSENNIKNVEGIKDKVNLKKLNLLNKAKTASLVKEIAPEIIFHLAALASPGDSFEKAAEFISNNSAAQINIFEAVRESDLLDTKIIVISSAHVYGLVKASDIPIDEDTPFNPDNPYSVSKITQDYLGLCYYSAYKLPIIRLRPFNHIGPRLSPSISVSRFAKNVAEIEKGLQEPVISVGNLEAKRDFTDVRDMVRAYKEAAEKCTIGEVYNIGTGVSYRIGNILDKLISLSKIKIEVKQDERLFRPSDIPELRADASKFMRTTDWKPEVPIEQTLKDVLDYWRGIV